MGFQTLDPSIVRALIEGQPDVLAEEEKEESEFYNKVSCPMCSARGSCEKRLQAPKIAITDEGPEVISSPFSPNFALPQGYAHCIQCGTDFDPYSKVISRTEASEIAPADPASKIVSPRSGPRQE